MRIGFDMGDTICCTNEKIIEYENVFCSKYNISLSELKASMELHNNFMDEFASTIYKESTIKDNVKAVINKLYDDGHEIYILTSRSSRYDNEMYNITRDFFENNGIKYTKIIVDCFDKVLSCQENNVNIMLEDNFKNFKNLIDNKIFCVLFDEKNCFPMVYNRITNWCELISVLKQFNKI